MNIWFWWGKVFCLIKKQIKERDLLKIHTCGLPLTTVCNPPQLYCKYKNCLCLLLHCGWHQPSGRVIKESLSCRVICNNTYNCRTKHDVQNVSCLNIWSAVLQWIQLNVLLMLYLFRVSSENNTAIFDRVINQILLEYGGPERCPWTRAIIEGTLLFANWLKAIYSNAFMCFKCWNWSLFHAWTLKGFY